MDDTDDPPLTGTTDAVKPWTIKAISTEARDLAITEARRANLTTGQWLERVIRNAADGAGADRPAGPPVAPVDLAALTGFINATVATVTAAADHPTLAPLARQTTALANKMTRTARGLAPRRLAGPSANGSAE